MASVFVSRWDTAVTGKIPSELRDRLGIAAATLAYRAYRELLDSPRWWSLANEGARPQRLLWASTSAKHPGAPDVLYVTALAAPFTINTMPEATLHAFADHGQAGALMPADGGDAGRPWTRTPATVSTTRCWPPSSSAMAPDPSIRPGRACWPASPPSTTSSPRLVTDAGTAGGSRPDQGAAVAFAIPRAAGTAPFSPRLSCRSTAEPGRVTTTPAP